jgi:glutamyl-tRNA synthetase
MVGWNPGTEQELFTKDQLIEIFDLSKVQKSPAVFNPEKLDWFNREYIKKLSSLEFLAHAKPFLPSWADETMLASVETMVRERIVKFADVATFFQESEYLFKAPVIDEAMLVWKTDTLENAKKHIRAVTERLAALGEGEWIVGRMKENVLPYAEAEGKGNVLWPVRVALSGKEKSPDPFEIMQIIGKQETLKRLSVY